VNRKTLEQEFLTQGSAPWKTFVMDVHSHGESVEFLQDVFGKGFVRETDDHYLHSVASERAHFTVDSLDDRFWSFHSISPAADASSLLKSVVARRRDLDFVWLPTAHLRMIQRGVPPSWIKTDFRGRAILPASAVQELTLKVRGREAQTLLDFISQNQDFPYAVSVSQLGVEVSESQVGFVSEAIDRLALFVARGDSFVLHQSVVQSVVARYRALVESAERVAIGFDPISLDKTEGAHAEFGGGRMSGGPIEFTFSRPITDIGLFLDGLLSSREPFRLWGVANDVFDDYSEVEAVDLHVGERIRIEVSPEMIRIHLRRGGCGNTVARLVSNLQHHVDGGIKAVDPVINRHLMASSPVAA
jgi:hypothetical protein